MKTHTPLPFQEERQGEGVVISICYTLTPTLSLKGEGVPVRALSICWHTIWYKTEHEPEKE
jgi:hypothetical protein